MTNYTKNINGIYFFNFRQYDNDKKAYRLYIFIKTCAYVALGLAIATIIHFNS